VVGDGSLRKWLEDYVANHSLAQYVRFLGETPQTRVQELMRAGDIVFLPSNNEGISLTIFEGMASGAVPVGADVGGQKELVLPENGFLIQRSTEDQEAEAYYEALSEIINHPDKRHQMSLANRKRVVEYFNLEVMGERMESLIFQAKMLRTKQPQQSPNQELNSLLARQTVEYMRTLGELKRIEPYIQNYMPPASASTYLYFAIRAFIFPTTEKIRQKKWFLTIKSKIKSILVH